VRRASSSAAAGRAIKTISVRSGCAETTLERDASRGSEPPHLPPGGSRPTRGEGIPSSAASRGRSLPRTRVCPPHATGHSRDSLERDRPRENAAIHSRRAWAAYSSRPRTGRGAQTYFELIVGTSRLRPFARRRFRTMRPAFVLMRERKPWVRFRRMRLG
jgi:hypothetical protein